MRTVILLLAATPLLSNAAPRGSAGGMPRTWSTSSPRAPEGAVPARRAAPGAGSNAAGARILREDLPDGDPRTLE
jgi:hypothetical protein